MSYLLCIEARLDELRKIGYSQEKLEVIIERYTGCPSGSTLSVNQQKRLAADLKQHVNIARKWHYCLTGHIC